MTGILAAILALLALCMLPVIAGEHDIAQLIFDIAITGMFAGGALVASTVTR